MESAQGCDRLDVLLEGTCCNAPLTVKNYYEARVSHVDESTGIYSFVLNRESISHSTLLASGFWTNFYLNQPIDYLKLDNSNIRTSMMVVSVNRDRGIVHRGLVRKNQLSDKTCVLYCMDEGRLATFPIDTIYATIKLVAETESMGFQCNLDYMELFSGTNLLKDTLEECNACSNPGLLRCNSDFRVFVKDLRRGFPTVDIWPLHLTDLHLSFNKVVAFICLSNWVLGLQRREVGSQFQGFVAHVSASGRLFIHMRLGNESPALQMEAFLLKCELNDVQKNKTTRSSKKLVEAETDRTRIYVGQSITDGGFYRCQIKKIYHCGVYVFFMDYGNTGFVRYEKLYAAKHIHPILERVPALAYGAFLYSTSMRTRISGKAVYKFFEETSEQFDLWFTVRHILPNSVSVIGKQDNLDDIDLRKILADRNIVVTCDIAPEANI